MQTMSETPTITRVNLYRSNGEWCYAAWAGDEFDHSDVVDVLDDATEDDARRELSRAFTGASIVRVDDI